MSIEQPNFETPKDLLENKPDKKPEEAKEEKPEEIKEKKETLDRDLQPREIKAVDTINSIIHHGLITPEKARELGLEFSKGSDNYGDNKKSKGVLATIEEIKSIKGYKESKGKNASKDDYLDYFQWKVCGLVNGSTSRSPVAILGEREFPEIDKEIEKNGKETVEERLKSGALVLMSTNESYRKLDEKATYQDDPGHSTGGILAFSELKPNLIEAIFVPSELFDDIKNSVPKNFKNKIIEVDKEITPGPEDADLYSREIIDNKLKIPDWPGTVSKYLSEAKLNKTFLMHGIRLPTQKEFNATLVPKQEKYD